jgi:methyl-accepting chemotaxis protein
MKTWSLQSKIIGIISIFVVSNLLVAGVAFDKLTAADESSRNIVTVLERRVAMLQKLKYNQTVIGVAARDVLLERGADERKAAISRMAAGRVEQEAGIDEFIKIASEQGKASLTDYRSQFLTWYNAFGELFALSSADRQVEAVTALRTQVAPLRQKMADVLDQVIKLNEERMEEAQREMDADYAAALIILATVTGLSLLVGSVLAAVAIRRLNRSIRNVVESLGNNSDQVASAAAQIASSSQELSQASTEQAASLEQTAASLEEIGAMVAKAAENATTTAAKSAESQARAEDGRQAVENMFHSMNDISQANESIMAQINASNQQMADIVRVIQEIGNKTKVINEIVFQTKLLSFNASVEAARAGEHGKGFAVVAEEVGNLAQMSGNAASEISEMLTGSINKVEHMVQDTRTKVQTHIEHGKQKIQAGVGVAQQCSRILKEIVENVTSVSMLAQEIAQGSREQANGVGEINRAMGQLDSVTQQNASTSEEAASAAEQLSAQAEALSDTVDELVRTIHGSAAQPSRRQPSAAVPRQEQRAAPATVHALKPVPKVAFPAASPQAKLKVAVGDGRVPSRSDDGFTDL